MRLHAPPGFGLGEITLNRQNRYDPRGGGSNPIGVGNHRKGCELFF